MVSQKRSSDSQIALKQFVHFTQAVIDTSSLIYLQEIEMLRLTANWLQLWTIPAVVRELGGSENDYPVHLIDPDTVRKGPESVDQALCRVAAELQMPVISEDRQILMRTRALNLPFFNTLMVLNFLFYKDSLDLSTYQTALARLRSIARYSSKIYEFGGKVFTEINRLKRSTG